MENSRKYYWQQAAKGGTIIGFVTVGFALLKYAVGLADVKFWSTLVGVADVVVFIALLYAFTKRMSAAADPVMGFTYGRCLGFVASMMLFTGIIMGVYTAIFNNFIAPENVKETIDGVMLLYQVMVLDDQFYWMYGMLSRMMMNPLWLLFAGIIGYVFQGVFFGLFTSAAAKKNPDVFADSRNQEDTDNRQ